MSLEANKYICGLHQGTNVWWLSLQAFTNALTPSRKLAIDYHKVKSPSLGSLSLTRPEEFWQVTSNENVLQISSHP